MAVSTVPFRKGYKRILILKSIYEYLKELLNNQGQVNLFIGWRRNGGAA